jgi:hypothetical protein
MRIAGVADAIAIGVRDFAVQDLWTQVAAITETITILVELIGVRSIRAVVVIIENAVEIAVRDRHIVRHTIRDHAGKR